MRIFQPGISAGTPCIVDWVKCALQFASASYLKRQFALNACVFTWGIVNVTDFAI